MQGCARRRQKAYRACRLISTTRQKSADNAAFPNHVVLPVRLFCVRFTCRAPSRRCRILVLRRALGTLWGWVAEGLEARWASGRAPLFTAVPLVLLGTGRAARRPVCIMHTRCRQLRCNDARQCRRVVAGARWTHLAMVGLKRADRTGELLPPRR